MLMGFENENTGLVTTCAPSKGIDWEQRNTQSHC